MVAVRLVRRKETDTFTSKRKSLNRNHCVPFLSQKNSHLTHSNVQATDRTLNSTVDLIVDSIQDVKGKNIVKLDLRNLTDRPTDCFIICEGDSNTQVNAIAERIRRRLKTEFSVSPSHSEGQKNANWVCLDYFDVVVHVFYRETRKFYELEDLWSDAEFTEYEDL